MLKDGNLELRQVYVNTLLELREKDENIVAVEADLAGSIGTKKFGEKYPESFIDCGIMEANMIGVGAGLSLTGMRPFIHTFGPFATRRVYDQFFLSLAFSQLDAVVLGSDSGVNAEYNGGTHMPFEDLGIVRQMFNCNIVEPSDEHMMKQLLLMSYEQGGLWYIRTARKARPQIYDENEKFELGKAKVVRDGKDIALMAYGISMEDALIAAEELKEEGIDAAVIDMFSINPLDKDIVREYMDRPIMTIENHSIINGLGSAVSEVIAESGKGTKFKRLGVNHKFGQTGSFDYLKETYEIDKDAIVKYAKELVK